MPGIRSTTAGGADWAKDVATVAYPKFAKLFPHKMFFFISNGYTPHEWQTAFHAADNEEKLTRFRHLVSGRRGGKTLSAAWETIFYALNPEQFHRDAHGVESSKPLWIWVLAKDHEVGFPSRRAVEEVLETLIREGHLSPKDFKWNRTEKKIEFANGTLLQFKSADDPQSLRGSGLDILWIDEAAFIPNDEAWGVVRPALSDKLGIVITTTTPKGMNWFYEKFWDKKMLTNPNHFRVEYVSLDSPYFDYQEWKDAMEEMHPILFKQEYMAAFNAMSGVALNGEWLFYYSVGEPDFGQIRLPVVDGKFPGRKFIGVDPASSLSDKADYFAMVLLGIHEGQGYILKTFKDRIDFPDQLAMIRDWFLEYRPEYIGIESNAYQRVLVQQAIRMEGLPPIVGVEARGKKVERIMAMSPVFKSKKIRIHETHGDFIQEWIAYDPDQSNPKDDLLDAAEIAVTAAGILLPSVLPYRYKSPAKSIDEEAWEQIQAKQQNRQSAYDPELGDMA